MQRIGRRGPVLLGLIVLVAAGLAGCTQPAGPGTVPYPAVGAEAVWEGDGRVGSMEPNSGWIAGPQKDDYEFVRLDGDRSLSVAVGPLETRWDLYQDAHRVVPFNWTFHGVNGTWPFLTTYVSAANGDVIRETGLRTNGSGGWSYGAHFLGRGTATPLGSSLFWGLELETGRTFTRNVTRWVAGSGSLDPLREPVTLRFEIGPRETVAGWDSYRIEVKNPSILEKPSYKAFWSELTFWVSPETPFIVQRQGTFAVPHLPVSPWSGTVTLSRYEAGDEAVTIDRSNRSYVWEPQAVDLSPWDGFKPPGNGSTFAQFPMDRALDVLENQDTTYNRYRLQHPNANIVEARYEPAPMRRWSFWLAEPEGQEGLEADVEKRGESGVPTDHRTQSTIIADPEREWVPPDTYDRFLSVDACWTLWDWLTGGQIPWSTLMVRMGHPGWCGFLPGAPGATAAGIPFPFGYDGAVRQGVLPEPPRR